MLSLCDARSVEEPQYYQNIPDLDVVGFEPTTQEFERTKIVHALDRAATVTGFSFNISTFNTGNLYLLL
jgi:hypothetical protein